MKDLVFETKKSMIKRHDINISFGDCIFDFERFKDRLKEMHFNESGRITGAFWFIIEDVDVYLVSVWFDNVYKHYFCTNNLKVETCLIHYDEDSVVDILRDVLFGVESEEDIVELIKINYGV